ncbi:MAG: hypothetical protein ACHQWU_12200 [Gemmatimonadales bacterium]
MAYNTPLRTHDLRRIAARADCDERTVARAILGMDVMPIVLARITRALRDLGYPRPPRADRDPPTGGKAA